MAQANDNNFIRWDYALSANLLTSSGFSGSLGAWSNEAAPIGPDSVDWVYDTLTARATGSGGDYGSRALSQDITITKGYWYQIFIQYHELLSEDTIIYLYFSDGTNSQQLVTWTTNGSPESIRPLVKADADYTKLQIVVVNNASPYDDIDIQFSSVYIKEIGFPTTCDDYVLPLIPGDEINFFTNFKTGFVLDAINFASTYWKLGLLRQDGDAWNVFMDDITTVNVYTIGGTAYALYTNPLTVPDIPSGFYRFYLYKYNNGLKFDVAITSNVFKKKIDTNYTAVLKYRNSKDIYDFNYEGLGGYYNQIRVDMNFKYPNYQENVRGYELYNGDFKEVSTTVTKNKEVQTRFFDENAHDAFYALIRHDELYIDGRRYKKVNSSYDVNWDEFDGTIANGIIRLQDYDYSQVIQNC